MSARIPILQLDSVDLPSLFDSWRVAGPSGFCRSHVRLQLATSWMLPAFEALNAIELVPHISRPSKSLLSAIASLKFSTWIALLLVNCAALYGRLPPQVGWGTHLLL